MFTVKLVAQQEASRVYLMEIDHHRPRRGRVYDRTREEIHPETLLDSIVKFGYWVEFGGSDEEREEIEREVLARLGV